MSETPRTDDVATIFHDGDRIDWVRGDFARQLERELNAFVSELTTDPDCGPSGRVVLAIVHLQRMKAYLASAVARAEKSERERDALLVHLRNIAQILARRLDERNALLILFGERMADDGTPSKAAERKVRDEEGEDGQ